MPEQWKDVHTHKGIYQVSDRGRVRRIGKSCGAKVGRIIKPSTRNGYQAAHLYHKCKQFTVQVHRLVAEAFIGLPPTSRHEVNHLNGSRADNRVENLEWCTRSENLWHAYHILGTMKRPDAPMGEDAGSAKLTEKAVREIRRLSQIMTSGKRQHTNVQLAEMFGVGNSNIGYILKRKTWKHI